MIGFGIFAASVWLALQSAGFGSASRLDAEGLSLLEQGQVSGAEARFREALQIDARDVDALNNLGVILRRASQGDGAASGRSEGVAKRRPHSQQSGAGFASCLPVG